MTESIIGGVNQNNLPFTASTVKLSVAMPGMMTDLGTILRLSSLTELFFVLIFLLRRLDKEDGCCASASREESSSVMTKTSFRISQWFSG
jgi:hypothetical protein